MTESERITFRIPRALKAAAEKRAKAAGVDMGEYLRSLVAKDCGVEVPDMPQGTAALSPRKRSKAGKAAAKKRWEKDSTEE